MKGVAPPPNTPTDRSEPTNDSPQPVNDVSQPVTQPPENTNTAPTPRTHQDQSQDGMQLPPTLTLDNLDTQRAYHEANENTINILALQRRASAKSSLRHSVRKRLERMKRSKYTALGEGESNDEAEQRLVGDVEAEG